MFENILIGQYIEASSPIHRLSAVTKLIMTVIFACSNERQEEGIYELLGGILEKEPEEVANQPIDELKEDLKKIAAENNLLVFFRQAQTLIQ